jgi:hypothetical protein
MYFRTGSRSDHSNQDLPARLGRDYGVPQDSRDRTRGAVKAVIADVWMRRFVERNLNMQNVRSGGPIRDELRRRIGGACQFAKLTTIKALRWCCLILARFHRFRSTRKCSRECKEIQCC